MANTGKLTRNYMPFYMDGRDEDRLLRNDIDVEKLAETVMNGEPLRETIMTAVRLAAAPLEQGRKRTSWLEEYEDEIKEAGGDGNEAYRHYLAGRIDELAYSLEDQVVSAMTAMVGDEEENEDDENEVVG